MVPEEKAAQAPQTLEGVATVVAEQAAPEAVVETDQPEQREEKPNVMAPLWCADVSPRQEWWTRCHEEWVESTDEGTESEQPRNLVVGASETHRP